MTIPNFTYTTDAHGIRNYNPMFLLGCLTTLLYVVIAVFAFALLWFEKDFTGANIVNYGDAFWTLQMSASTIGFGDHFPVSPGGRWVVAAMFYIGVGVAGSIGTILAAKIMGFSDTAVQNRELRTLLTDSLSQDADTLEQSRINGELMVALQKKMEKLDVISDALNQKTEVVFTTGEDNV